MTVLPLILPTTGSDLEPKDGRGLDRAVIAAAPANILEILTPLLPSCGVQSVPLYNFQITPRVNNTCDSCSNEKKSTANRPFGSQQDCQNLGVDECLRLIRIQDEQFLISNAATS